MVLTRQFLRFLFVGALNTVVGYAVFASLSLAGAGPTLALVGATVLGVAFNFQTYMRLVFRADTGGVLPFVALYGLTFAINWTALQALVNVGVSTLLGQALLAGPMALLSYLGQRNFVFKGASRCS